MNATLWVIWSAGTIAALFAGLAIGSHFPARHLLDAKYWDGRRDEAKVVDHFREQALDRAWREGYEKGCDDELASCAPCEHEPLARGAGGTHPPVTTAPCSGDAARMAPKGDSPGPGTCPCCGKHLRDQRWGDDAPFCWDCGLYARDPAADCDNEDHKPAVDFVFVPANSVLSPIFDDLATSWPQLATPLASPPGGVAPEPSAPVLAPARNGHDPGAEDKPPGSAHAPVWISGGKEIGPEVKPPGPETCPPISEQTGPLEGTGPGPDPLFSALDDAELFAWAQFELRHVLEQAAEPFGLTPWKETTR